MERRVHTLLSVLLATVLLTVSLLLLLVSCGGGNSQVLGEYLTPYKEKATEFLLSNEEFIAAYGKEVEPGAAGYSFTYVDPGKYTGISLSPKIPATAEEFAREVKELQVNYFLSDNRTCSVYFEKTPEGGLEITGWAYTDEADN